jgi:hypothetical protein
MFCQNTDADAVQRDAEQPEPTTALEIPTVPSTLATYGYGALEDIKGELPTAVPLSKAAQSTEDKRQTEFKPMMNAGSKQYVPIMAGVLVGAGVALKSVLPLTVVVGVVFGVSTAMLMS